jgi:LysR family cyn operon transcriptional activator
MLNLEYLEHFLITTKYMSFTVAAEKLFMNQSTLSRQISSIEEECHAPLFDRTGRMLRLTEAGLKLQEEGAILLSLQAQI